MAAKGATGNIANYLPCWKDVHPPNKTERIGRTKNQAHKKTKGTPLKKKGPIKQDSAYRIVSQKKEKKKEEKRKKKKTSKH